VNLYRAVFLSRDGTPIKERQCLSAPVLQYPKFARLGEDFPTTKDTKNTKKSQADGLVQIFVLFVSFVVNIGLRLGSAGGMATLAGAAEALLSLDL
jgi:hypothetical protein